jgi:hypothetical protein
MRVKNNRGSKARENNFQTEDLEIGNTNATTEDLPDSHGSDRSRSNGG